LHALLVSPSFSPVFRAALALYRRKRHAPACVPPLPPDGIRLMQRTCASLSAERMLPTSIPGRALVSLDDREGHPVLPDDSSRRGRDSPFRYDNFYTSRWALHGNLCARRLYVSRVLAREGPVQSRLSRYPLDSCADSSLRIPRGRAGRRAAGKSEKVPAVSASVTECLLIRPGRRSTGEGGGMRVDGAGSVLDSVRRSIRPVTVAPFQFLGCFLTPRPRRDVMARIIAANDSEVGPEFNSGGY